MLDAFANIHHHCSTGSSETRSPMLLLFVGAANAYGLLFSVTHISLHPSCNRQHSAFGGHGSRYWQTAPRTRDRSAGAPASDRRPATINMYRPYPPTPSTYHTICPIPRDDTPQLCSTPSQIFTLTLVAVHLSNTYRTMTIASL